MRVKVFNVAFIVLTLAVCIGLAFQAGGWAWLYCPLMWFILMCSLYGPGLYADRMELRKMRELEYYFRQVAREEQARQEGERECR